MTKKIITTPENTFANQQSKGTEKANEMIVFFEFLSDKVTSCTDAAMSLCIPQKHLTRYKRKFEAVGKLQVVKRLRCPHTRRWVQYITTDRTKFLQPVQLNLFEQ